VRALLGLGHGLGLTVTAEAEELRSQGCQQAQAFLYSRAAPCQAAAVAQ
jgi:EAL domain-containing protein (putative c-di-GMP-specific phosphodiesterase class I)